MASPVSGSPTVNQVQERAPNQGTIPFRRATSRRAQLQVVTGPQAISAAVQPIEVQLLGTGYFSGLDITVQCVTAANAAVVAYQEDAPYSAIGSVVVHDPNGDLVNMDSISLEFEKLYNATMDGPNEEASLDTNVFQKVAGAGGGIGGSFLFHLWVPIATNDRDLLGLLGNQNRAVSYAVRSDINPSTLIYSTPPTTPGNLTLTRMYESYAVPAPSNANGARQQIEPPKLGILHFITRFVNTVTPAGGADLFHPLQRLGNTIRLLILVFRSNGSRVSAEAALPTKITFILGDVPLFSETPQYRRVKMWRQYGFDAPAGVMTYDGIQDFVTAAGAELGNDWWWTNGLSSALFECVYPAAFGVVNNSLTIITDDIQIPRGMNVYAAV